VRISINSETECKNGTHNVSGLDVVFEPLDGLLQIVQADLVVLDDNVDLQLLDAETDGDQLPTTPDKAILLNPSDSGLQLLHISLIVCQ
jgi:hypothetical protein